MANDNMIPNLRAVRNEADAAAVRAAPAVADEAALAGKTAGQYELTSTSELVAWNGAGVTARGPMPQASEPLNHRDRAAMLDSINPARRHIAGGDIFDLLPASDPTPVDNGYVLRRKNGDKLRRAAKQGTAYADWWELSNQHGPADNKASLKAALDWCYTNGVHRLKIPAEHVGNHNAVQGVHISPGLEISSNMRVECDGLTRFIYAAPDGDDWTIPLFRVFDAEAAGDRVGTSFDQTHAAGLSGIMITSAQAGRGRGIYYGDKPTPGIQGRTSGSMFLTERGGITNMEIATLHGSNNWLTHTHRMIFSHNAVDVLLESGINNGGENMLWERCTFDAATLRPVICRTGLGTGLNFDYCSFDYGVGAIAFEAANAVATLTGCWLESDRAGEWFTGGQANTVNLLGGSIINTTPDPTQQVITNSTELAIRSKGLRYAETNARKTVLTRGRQISIPAGQNYTDIWVPFANIYSMPEVVPLNNCGIYWLEPRPGGDANALRIVVSDVVPAGGSATFMVSF